MDRTIIAPWKAEEKDLSERLYKKMQGLTLLFTPSEELRKCLSEEMFLKPNQHAFFHVMHFLCRALDPAEFKKRFYWPISDKRSESMFRTATVEYLKHLSDKHNLQWNIKSYLVVMPGGIKFITFLLEFIALLVKELTVQRERQLACGLETNKVIDWNIKRFRMQNQMLKHFASKFITDMDALILKYNENITLIKKELDVIAADTGVSVRELVDEHFQLEFNADNQKLFDLKFRKPTAKLVSLEAPSEALKDIVDISHCKDSTTNNKINKKTLREAITAFNQQYLHHDSLTSDAGDEIRMKSLIATFNCLHADVLESLNQAEAAEHDYDFLNSELCTLRSEFEELEKQMKNFQQSINANSQLEAEKQRAEQLAVSLFHEVSTENFMLKGDKKATMNVLLSKYVSTPPIKCDLMGSGRAINYRLPLLYQQNVQIKDDLDIFIAPSRTTRQLLKNSIADQSLKDLNSTMNRSKIIDPMQLLRTLQKSNSKIKPSPQRHQQRNDNSLSKLGSKWRERESLFTDNQSNIADSTLADVTIKQELTFSSPTVSKSCNSSRRSGSQLQQYTKKLSAVKKVQSASINLHNLSTSPSGRLEPLVNIDNNVKEFVKILLNDESLNDTTISTRKSCLLVDEGQSNSENNQNIINIIEPKLFVRDNSFESEEQLFNISDSVLKDISF